jgi:bifunctional non-homologous end joining protein LigD
VGDPHAAMDDAPGTLDALLAVAEQQAKSGQGDATWPPHYRRQAGEAPRVAPSRRAATRRRPARDA